MAEFILSKKWKKQGWNFDKKFIVADDASFFIVLNEFIPEIQEGIYSLFDTKGIEKLLKDYNYQICKLPNSRKMAGYVNMPRHFIELMKPMIVYAILKKEGLLPWFNQQYLAKKLGIVIPKHTSSGIDYENISLISNYDKFVSIKKLAIEDDTTVHDTLSMFVSIMYSLLNMRSELISKLGMDESIPDECRELNLSKNFKGLSKLIDYAKKNKYSPIILNKLLNNIGMSPFIDPNKFNSVYKDPELKYLKIKVKRKKRKK
ncbi:hypothetical protein J7J26_02330 [Candidatus Micrarchaeota archaeon]|nr:hypothetical protein [Candidatus Micrarchaeota archaeon]